MCGVYNKIRDVDKDNVNLAINHITAITFVYFLV